MWKIILTSLLGILRRVGFAARKMFLLLQLKNKVKHQGLGQAFSGMSLLYLTVNSWKHNIILVSYV